MMITAPDWLALWTTLKLASITTVILLAIGLPVAWWLARTSWRYKYVLEASLALPLVLPPTVLGFYLLLALGPQGPIGSLSIAMGGAPLAFSFTGLLIGSVIYSLPFVVQPLQSSFSMLDRRTLEAAATLGASPLDRFLNVVLPMTKPGLITASVLGFAHTLGEFGVVLMIGGNLPGETRVASIAIYEHVESLEYAQAHALSALLLLFSLLLLIVVFRYNRGRPKSVATVVA